MPRKAQLSDGLIERKTRSTTIQNLEKKNSADSIPGTCRLLLGSLPMNTRSTDHTHKPILAIYFAIYLATSIISTLLFSRHLRDGFLRLFVREEDDCIGRERTHNRRSKPAEEAAQALLSQLVSDDAKQRHGDRIVAGLELRFDSIQGECSEPGHDA